MAKKSTKYQLLEDDFRHACEELRKRNEMIKQLREELEEEQGHYIGLQELNFQIEKENKELKQEIEQLKIFIGDALSEINDLNHELHRKTQ